MWMANKEPVHRKQLETFLLRLNQQQFVKWIPVRERRFQGTRGMPNRHRQESDFLIFQSAHDIVRSEAALALAGRMPGVVLQTHLPDGHGADV